MLEERISGIQNSISLICQSLGKNPEDVTLVGVTKFADASKIKSAIDYGLRSFGESKVQEAKKKYPGLKEEAPDICLRMIGHLQTNKVKQVLEIFDTIDSLDSLKLAKEINKQAEGLERNIEVLLQVNTSGEEQKFGVSPNEVVGLVEEINTLPRITVTGLMTIAPFVDDKDVIRKSFQDLRELYEHVKVKFSGSPQVDMKYLSMGMTHDFEIALEEGSNMIRVGTAIFGD